MKNKLIYFLIVIPLILSACGQATVSPTSTATPPRTLIVMTHDSFAASKSVISKFETANNVKVQFIASGDAGTALNKAILSKDNPFADVFYGVDNTFLSRALTEDIFQPYNSPMLTSIPDQYKLDPQNRALPVDWADVCLNYDMLYFSQHSLPLPQNLEDLVKPEYKNLLAVENPATSSPGLAFLLTTIGHFGADKYLDYWRGLVSNNVLVVNDWNTAFYTDYSRYGGDRPIVVSYSSDPAFEVIGSKTPITAPQTAVITSDGSCFQQMEFVGILRGTKNMDLAEKWVDFMLSTIFQEDMPLQMYVFPVNPQAKLNDTFQKFLVTPEHPASITPDDIAANREAWINAWTETVLR
jgi:thiamine transport system substrate-binding protein